MPDPLNLRPILKLERLYTIGGMAPIDLTEGYDYIILQGGRSGGKSETVAQLFVLLSRIVKDDFLCTREIQKAMKDSVKKMIDIWIRDLGLTGEFYSNNTNIINRFTGASFSFIGMEAAIQSDTVKSLKGFKYVWYEEAQTATMKSLKKLTPTIRINDRKLIFTLNRNTTEDAVIKYFENKKKVLWINISYLENPYCPQVAIDEAEELKELDYPGYCHEWLGEPRAEDANRVVLPYEKLSQCVDLHKKIGYKNEAKRTGGFDVADGILEKHDKNALVTRTGPVVDYAEDWRIDEVYKSVNRINSRFNTLGFDTLQFDATSLGVAAKSEFSRLEEEKGEKLPYYVIPFRGASEPGGKNKVYVSHGRAHKVTNGMMFKNKKAQTWWNLRLRLENSMRLLKGDKIERPDYFLSFSSDIHDLDSILRELSQAIFEEDSAGKILVVKTPGTREVEIDGKKKERKSPNKGDATGYAFADDCRNGLRPGKKASMKARVIA